MKTNRMLLVLCTSLWLLGCNTIHGMGRDIEEVFRQIQREQELARAYGITIDLSPSSMASQPVIPADPNTDPTTSADHDAPLKLIGGA
jgi:predicted small secreted protein